MATTAIKTLLARCPVITRIPVQWGDMDAFGHVNNVMYFKYFETARIAYVNKMLSDPELTDDFRSGFLSGKSVGPIVATNSCSYKMPLVYPDEISVGARADLVDGAFIFTFVCVSHNAQRIAAEGASKVVIFDYAQKKKVPAPEQLVAATQRLNITHHL